MTTLRWFYLVGLVGALGACAQHSESPSAAAPPAAPPPPSTGATTPPAVEALYVYFDADSAKLNKQAEETADHAARLYREGNPHVMKIVGHTDATGNELYNLYLSARRANAVKAALVARGIRRRRSSCRPRARATGWRPTLRKIRKTAARSSPGVDAGGQCSVAAPLSSSS